MARINPYRPGAGIKPPILTGRDEILSDMNGVMDDVQHNGIPAQPTIVAGLRGMGKTSLLNEIVDIGRSKDWLTAKIEVLPGDSLPLRLYRELTIATRRYEPVKHAATKIADVIFSVLKSFQMTVDPNGIASFRIDAQPMRGYSDSGALDTDLKDLLEVTGNAVRDYDIGVLLAIDELQEAQIDDLKALNAALHQLGQASTPVPLVFIGTGLPALADKLTEASTYAERLYRYRELHALDEQDTIEALDTPAKDEDVIWDDDALKLVAEKSGGYPYFVQQSGSATWKIREHDDAITLEDAQAGLATAQDEIDRGLYHTRWAKASPVGRKTMYALALLGGYAKTRDIALTMGKSRSSDISAIRDTLIKVGQVYVPERGYLAFTVPGFDEYIVRTQDPDEFDLPISGSGV